MEFSWFEFYPQKT